MFASNNNALPQPISPSLERGRVHPHSIVLIVRMEQHDHEEESVGKGKNFCAGDHILND